MLYRAVASFCAGVIRLFCRTRVEVRGRENVPVEGPAVLVANHASYLDPPVMAMALRRQVHFMAREEVLTVALLGPLLRGCGVFAVRPGTADRAAIRRAVALLGEGKLVGIFPEGTRSADGGLQSAHPGAALIASRAGVPLIPVAIQGTWEAFPRDARWMRPAPISITFGSPIYPREEDARSSRGGELAGISRRIMEEIDRLLAGQAEADPPKIAVGQ
jgi:1-acyl-sn-glycerol-3-phosphate acyltransferase